MKIISKYINDFRTIIVRSPNFGVDKLTLTTKDFAIKDTKNLNLTGLTKIAGDSDLDFDVIRPIFQVGGEPIYGSKAYLNTDQFSININSKGLQIVCNPSKMAHPYHLLNDELQIEKQVVGIEKECRKLGVSFDALQTRVSRFDLARQGELPRNFLHYDSAFKNLCGKNGRNTKKQTYEGTTYYSGNNTHQFCFYDKFFDLKKQNSNFGRAELRCLKTAFVKKEFHATTLIELLGNGADHWFDTYKNYCEKNIFSAEKEIQLSLFDTHSLEKLVSECYQLNSGKGLINRVTAILGVRTIFDTPSLGLDRYLNLFAPYFDERTIRRHKVRLYDMAQKSVMIGRPIELQVLVDELKKTFLYAA
jgi:hypothetical protein